ncbi:hypothetical protein Taro_046810 [Colocasia esculenta]|uniref:MHD domain-containing protein n=1 Tax=Colocasia esculenta TaxID=4460 RepID=A0A843X6K3_COLES|nr:hypothetical protein [Colocasia esculenta]
MSDDGSCCSVRAIWILNPQDSVVFSRRFPVVEKRWRTACQKEREGAGGGCAEPWLLPTDEELALAFAERRRREGSTHGFGIRSSQSVQGSDSWIDDPITRHVISLSITSKRGGGEKFLLWPLVFHLQAYFHILVLPLVEPQHLKTYERISQRSDCGSSVGGQESLSSLLLDLPCITGAFLVAHSLGDIITGENLDPEVVVSSTPSVGGLLDSLTGSIGISSISARAKPAAASVSSSTTSGSAVSGASSDAPKSSSRSIDRDALRSFISSSMPFGTPLDLNYANIAAIKLNGFSSSDVPPLDLKQPAWKPYLYKGKQRMLFTIHEIVHAAMYDRDEIPDAISISGQVNCRAELEGLPDVSFPLTGLNTARVEVLSFHPCAQVPEQGMDKHAVMFSPPLGNFVLMRYQAFCNLDPPVKGFYQLSMVSENEGAFLFKLRLMEGYKAPLSMEYCTVSMPFPRRGLVFFDGNPSVGTISTTEHSVEWKIITPGRGISGKSIEATFPGTIRFSPQSTQKVSSASRFMNGCISEDDSDLEQENSSNSANVEEFLMEKMNKEIPPADMEQPFCWQAYNYAKVRILLLQLSVATIANWQSFCFSLCPFFFHLVSFKVVGGTLSGMTMDPKSVSIYPAVKAPVEFSMQMIQVKGRCEEGAGVLNRVAKLGR